MLIFLSIRILGPGFWGFQSLSIANKAPGLKILRTIHASNVKSIKKYFGHQRVSFWMLVF